MWKNIRYFSVAVTNLDEAIELYEGMLTVYLPGKLKPAQYRQLVELGSGLAEHVGVGGKTIATQTTIAL